MKSFRWKYAALNKVFFLLLFVLGLSSFGTGAWGQVSYLPEGYQIKLDEQGNIPPEFWSYEVPFKPVSQTITFIETHVDLTKQQPINLDPDDEDSNLPQWEKNKKFVDDVIQTLKQGGVTLNDEGRFAPPEQAVAGFSVSQIGQSGLYLWSPDGQSFLVNPLKPSQIIPLYFKGDWYDWGIGIDSAKAQFLSPNVYRVFCNLTEPSNGCGAAMSKWLSVIDVDFKHGTLAQTDLPMISWSDDLNQDGNVEVVISAGVDNEVFFPWVYTWDGKKWADRRAQFWHCYQNGKLAPWAFCNSGSMSKAPDALDKAIKAGEPLKYWKATSSAAVATSLTGTVPENLSSAREFLAKKDYASAIISYQKALALDNANFKIYLYLGYAYVLNGQKPQALDALIQATALEADSPLARYNMAFCDWVFRDQETPDALDSAAAEAIKAFDWDPSLKTTAIHTPMMKGLLDSTSFRFAVFWDDNKVPAEFLKAFPTVPYRDWVGQTFVFLSDPGLGPVAEDDDKRTSILNDLALKGRPFKILGPIDDTFKAGNNSYYLRIQMLDDGHRYKLSAGACYAIGPYQDFLTAKKRWLGHPLWCVSQKPVTLESGTVLSKMQEVTVTDVQLGDQSQNPLRLVLKTSQGVVDSIPVWADCTNFQHVQIDEAGNAILGDGNFLSLFSEVDPAEKVKTYLTQVKRPSS